MGLVASVGIACCLYAAFEVGRLVESLRGSRRDAPFAYDIETGERVPLFVERRNRERRSQ